ncbi:MAG: class I SAM-dependent methyltransferase [bacterium]|nr:class I SAM-dependent methyltransferase [bacterium]
MNWIISIIILLLLGGLAYWLLVTTEGVFLGRRVVVWLYDLTAHKYDDIKEFEPEWEQFFIAHPVMHKLDSVRAPLILDVATGTGRVPFILLEEPLFHGRVVGIDPSRKMLKLAAEKLRPFSHRAPLIQQTANALPFPDNSFDAVTCIEALEFFPSDIDALREMVRVLRPGGLLFVTRRRGWEGKAFLARYRPVKEFEATLTNFGLEDVNTQPWQFAYDQVFARKR